MDEISGGLPADSGLHYPTAHSTDEPRAPLQLALQKVLHRRSDQTNTASEPS